MIYSNIIYTIKDEIYISLYLILFGIYLIAISDLFEIFITKVCTNKYIIIVSRIIFYLLQIYITYLFSYRLKDGYIPIWFIVFFALGWFLYWKFFKKTIVKFATMWGRVFNKMKPLLQKTFKNLIINIQVFQTIKKMIIKLANFIKRIFKKLKRKKYNDLDEEIDFIDTNEIEKTG